MSWRCSGSSNKALIENLYNSGIIKSTQIYNALNFIDRANFAPRNPYEDSPQGIGNFATISAPHMHAYALEYLKDSAFVDNARILDVGSGSGYLTAAFAYLNPTAKVYAIDYIPELVELTTKNIMKENKELIESGRVKVILGNGWEGHSEGGPYNVIHVGAAAAKLPQALLNQLEVKIIIFPNIPMFKFIKFS